MPLTACQQVEIFHILFLRHLEGRLDKSLYALKGGCNLRFFMKSIRYSEDLDLDVRTVARHTLTKKITSILDGTALRTALQSNGIAILSHTAPKQTDTTQRWKIQLKMAHSALPVPTKIECSRRRFEAGTEFGPVEPELIQTYQLYQVLCSHYGRDAACRQKLAALVGRSAVQARDVFDLSLLIDQGADPGPLPAALRKHLRAAEAVILGIGCDTFVSQVVSYLSIDQQSYYRSEKVWAGIQAKVLQHVQEWV